MLLGHDHKFNTSDILNLQDVAAEEVAVNATEHDICSATTWNTNSFEHGSF
jgi:hypothetical protein